MNKKVNFLRNNSPKFPKGNRGQFFILAAVILSLVIISLASVSNYVSTSKEPEKFYDLSEEIKQETSKVIDYGVYQEEDIQAKIQDFTSNVSIYMKDQDPDTEFIFAYGNQEKMIIENYGKEEVNIAGNIIEPGSKEFKSKVKLVFGDATSKVSVTETGSDYNNKWRKQISTSSDKVIVQVMSENTQNNYSFNLNKDQQFLIIMQKKRGNETYTDIR